MRLNGKMRVSSTKPSAVSTRGIFLFECVVMTTICQNSPFDKKRPLGLTADSVFDGMGMGPFNPMMSEDAVDDVVRPVLHDALFGQAAPGPSHHCMRASWLTLMREDFGTHFLKS